MRDSVIAASNAAEVRDESDAKESGAPAGELEQMGRGHVGQIVVSGWAIIPNKFRAADAVFLTFQNQNRQPTIFSMADMGGAREDLARNQGNTNYLRSGWEATIPVDRVPSHMTLIKISAWALDTETGKAFKLKGEATLSR